MKKILILMAVMLTSWPCFSANYVAGQIWSYRSRPDEEGSKLTILRVEPDSELGSIVHIRLEGVNLKRAGAPTAHFINHMVFSKAALDKSVLKLLGNNSSLPDFSKNYDTWKQIKSPVMTNPVNVELEKIAQQLAK